MNLVRLTNMCLNDPRVGVNICVIHFIFKMV
jgi:hypothetical protein